MAIKRFEDIRARQEASKTCGPVKVLGDRWDSLAAFPDNEIEAIHKVHTPRVPARSYSYLQEGERVGITRRLLPDVEGILLRNKPNKGLVVISIYLLQQSGAVRTDCTMIGAAQKRFAQQIPPNAQDFARAETMDILVPVGRGEIIGEGH